MLTKSEEYAPDVGQQPSFLGYAETRVRVLDDVAVSDEWDSRIVTMALLDDAVYVRDVVCVRHLWQAIGSDGMNNFRECASLYFWMTR